jgi:hemerythrin
MRDEQVVAETVEAIKHLLARKPPPVQGAILADLLAMWLAGHFAEDDANATRELREQVLTMHCEYVRKLVPVNAKIIGTPE